MFFYGEKLGPYEGYTVQFFKKGLIDALSAGR